MDSFPPNSKTAQEANRPREARHVDQVTSTEARVRRKPLGARFKETFVRGDLKSTSNYLFYEEFMPQAQQMFLDLMQRGMERLVLGAVSGVRGGRTNVPSGYSNLGRFNYAGVQGGPTTRHMSQQARQSHNFGEIVCASRVEANEVIGSMYDLLSQYELVTVADLYKLTGIGSSHVDYKWGWTDLTGATTQRTRNNDYVLVLPKPEFLD